MKYVIQTFGCQMNYSDSERIATVLEVLGYKKSNKIEEADLLIFNTCSVRQKAEDRVYGLRKTLASLHKKNKKLLVGVTGCMVRKTSTQKDEKKDQILRVMSEIDFVFKIEELASLPNIIKKKSYSKTDKIDAKMLKDYFHIIPKKEALFSVFVPIMTGCDKFCTYCIVPYARGREKSRNFDEILKECKRHVVEGAIEITLVGQTVNSYGLSFKDRASGEFEKYGESPFAKLLLEVDKLSKKGLKRLRFMSPHPRDFNETLIKTLPKLKTLCPYIHMPIQSGDDNVLRRMNRNYTVKEYKEIAKKLRKVLPTCALSTDIIVGFSGETDKEFQNTLKLYKEITWDMCYLAQYSPRKGTYAYAHLKDSVSHKKKLERWHKLNNLLRQVSKEKHTKFIGKTVEVLVNEQKGKICRGRTPESKEMQFNSDENLLGKLVFVKVTACSNFYLNGELSESTTKPSTKR